MAAGHEPDIRLVLVRPSDSRNVGAACRAAKTMGIAQLVLVAGDRIEPAEARITAVHAGDLVDGAIHCESVAEAIDGCSLAAAITRRSGKRRKYRVWTPEELGRHAAGGGDGADGAGRTTLAVVFGNEKDGLTDEEVAPCHVAVSIPSSPEFPSLNLSHAVQIVAYELYKQRVAPRRGPANDLEERQRHPRRGTPRRAQARRSRVRQKAVAATRLGELVEPFTSALARAGFFSSSGADSVRRFLVDILARADIVDREAQRLGRILGNVGGLIGDRSVPPAEADDSRSA